MCFGRCCLHPEPRLWCYEDEQKKVLKGTLRLHPGATRIAHIASDPLEVSLEVTIKLWPQLARTSSQLQLLS